MAEMKFIVDNISCEGCADKIRQSLENLGGVEELTIAMDKRLVVVLGEADPEEIEKAIQDAGYSPSISKEEF